MYTFSEENNSSLTTEIILHFPYIYFPYSIFFVLLKEDVSVGSCFVNSVPVGLSTLLSHFGKSVVIPNTSSY